MTVKLFIVGGWAWPTRTLAPLVDAFPKRFHAEAVSVCGASLDAVNDGLSPYASALMSAVGSAFEPCVAAWSMGALAAMELAASRPGLLRKLALIGAFPRFTAAAGYGHGAAPASFRMLRKGMAKEPAAALADFFSRCAKPAGMANADAMRLAAEAIQEFGVEGLRASLDWLARADVRGLLGLIDAQVMLLHGKRDEIVPLAAAEYMSAALKSATLCVHPEAGHDLPVSMPEWTVKTITSQ